VTYTEHEELEDKEVAVLWFKIFEQNKLAKEHSCTNAEIAKYAPSNRKMESYLKKRRDRARPKLPKELRSYIVSSGHHVTSNGNRLLISITAFETIFTQECKECTPSKK
jgi:hypothetical protein